MKRLRICISETCWKKYKAIDKRISDLPEPILHQILSFLPTKDATKTCVLSKTWNSAWNRFGMLDFIQDEYFENKYGELIESSQEFFDYVNNSIARRCQNLSIQRFKLAVYISDKFELEDVDRWLVYALSNHVEHLVVLYCFNTFDWPFRYIFPTSALLHAKSLTKLELCDCKLSVESGIDRNIGCSSLRTLILRGCYIDDKTLQSLLSNSSSSLEEVCIAPQDGLRSVRLCSTKLTTFQFGFTDKIEKMSLDAPNLRFLNLSGECRAHVLTTTLYDASKYSKNLKELVLSEVDINDGVFRVIREFRVLEKLELRDCSVKVKNGINIISLKSVAKGKMDGALNQLINLVS